VSEFYFYAYTVGSRWGNNGIRCKSLVEARKTAEMLAKGDCFHAEVGVSRSIGVGADFRIEPLFTERVAR
jgi:hypothetical protein